VEFSPAKGCALAPGGHSPGPRQEAWGDPPGVFAPFLVDGTGTAGRLAIYLRRTVPCARLFRSL